MYEDDDTGDDSMRTKCLNCGNNITADDKYCPACGQKNIDGRITFRQFISDFFDAAFNLDSRFFKTIPALFVPGKLTTIYFSGKHNTYIKPLRLFFTTMILFYAVLGFKYLNKLEDRLQHENPMVMHEHAQFFDTVIAHIGYDTLTNDQQAIVDTIVKGIHAPFDEVILDSDLESDDNLIQIWDDDTTDITLRDIYTLSTDSIFRKYNIEGFSHRLTVRQTIALTKSPGKVVRFIIGNTTWMILIMLPAVAGFMQLMYIRRKKFFIEHLIFLYHYHAAAFLVLTIFLLLLPWMNSTMVWLIYASLSVFFLVAMKLFYAQNWFKTILKFVLLGIAYFFLTGIFAILTSVVSFFIYQ